jgi:asparagine synthase (glutamine-hydrolysing)
VRQVAARTFLTRGQDLDDLYFDNFAVFDRSAQDSLLTMEARSAIGSVDPYAAFHDAMARAAGRPLLARLLYADTKTYLHELLMKQDQMSMAASIESRVPFLDHPLAEWVARLPDGLRLRRLTTKWILRAAMRDRLPREIVTRRKMGFPVPVGAWLRTDWRHLLAEYVTSTRARSRGLFDRHVVERHVREHEAGINHSERLWALINFEVWARLYLDRASPADLPMGPA